MFGKPASASGAPVVEPARKSLAASLIAENVRLTGDLASDGEVHLDGQVQGDVRVERLTLGAPGAVEGVIEADIVEIRGRVRGSITARSVRLYASADVEGDICHSELSMEAGARFTGRSLRPEIAAAPALSVITAAE
jgi:cytoskeletal protein CcmA (bactofilin family)